MTSRNRLKGRESKQNQIGASLAGALVDNHQSGGYLDFLKLQPGAAGGMRE
jgi:hypothetical protein